MRKMFELEQQGVNRKTIANKMGISPSKVSSYLNNFSYYYLGKPRTLTEEELEKIKQYIQLGYGNVKIGQILGHGHTTIQN